jgi:hypothetical protein
MEQPSNTLYYCLFTWSAMQNQRQAAKILSILESTTKF